MQSSYYSVVVDLVESMVNYQNSGILLTIKLFILSE